MSDRKAYIGGNWKMNLHTAEAKELAGTLAGNLKQATNSVDVVVCPPFPYLSLVGQSLSQAGAGGIKLGAQDLYHQANGAFTGEISASMVKDVGASVVLCGHSERRHVIGENDELINAKVLAALEAGLEVILCVGEKLEQREAGQTDAVNVAQTYYGLAGVSEKQMQQVTIAYEPVWAIGTGKTATPDDAQNAHATIRQALTTMYGEKISQATRIQYGGSVKPDNAATLFAKTDVDGFLVGGASLKTDAFTGIVQAAC